MNTGIFVEIILGVIFMTIVIILISVLFGSKRKTKVLSQIDIITDELDRQKKENIHLKAELRRINSLDNLFFASMIRLTSTLNPVEIASETKGLLANYLGSEKLAVFLYDDKGKRLNIITQQGVDENWMPKIVYNLGEGKVGVAAAKRMPIGRREFGFDGTKSEPFAIFDPDICYPLFYRDKLYGVIAICRDVDFEEREKNLLGVVSTMTAVALHNTRSFESIQLSADTDPLTRLFNIGRFRKDLDKELSRAKRFQHNLSVAIIDLDKFKEYNDTYGHQAGDHLLIQLAQIFRDHFDETDTLARYGGDEFIVMCPEIKKHENARIVGNLLHDLEMYEFARGQQHVKVTFSAGVSSYPDDAINAGDLIKLADVALYEAKRAGRNTVQEYHPKVKKI